MDKQKAIKKRMPSLDASVEQAMNAFNDAAGKDAFFSDILENMNDGTLTVEMKRKHLLRAMNEDWINAVEDTLDAIDAVIRKPSRFIEESEAVLPIELTKGVHSRSLQHLATHTQYLNKGKNGKYTPTKLLNVFRDETLMTYENKFLNSLIKRTCDFVQFRYKIIKQGCDEVMTEYGFSNKFKHGQNNVTVKLSIEYSKPNDEKVNKEHVYSESLYHRVAKLRDVCMSYAGSTFCQMMGNATVHSPIVRTNAILRNKELRKCLELWEFIEGYESNGYGFIVNESLETVDNALYEDTLKLMATQYALFRRGIKESFRVPPIAERSWSVANTEPNVVDRFGPIMAKDGEREVTVAPPLTRTRRKTKRDAEIEKIIGLALKSARAAKRAKSKKRGGGN